MTSPSISSLEQDRRLALLAELDILDTPAEPAFDALAAAARLASGWPMALVGLIDREREWFKVHDGLPLSQTTLAEGFGQFHLITASVVEVPDALADSRFAAHPLVCGAPFVRAYAGQALLVQGVPVGALYLLHDQPARLDRAQQAQLRALAAAVSGLLTERLNRALLVREQERFSDFGAASGDWLWESDEQGRVAWLSAGYERVLGRPASEQLGQPWGDLPLLDARGHPLQPRVTLSELDARGLAYSRAVVCQPTSGGDRFLSMSAVPVHTRARDQCGMRGSARDVSQQVHAERLRDAETDRLKKLVAQVPGALYQFRVDATGAASFPFASQGLQSLFEVSPGLAAANAQPVFDRIHPEDLPGIQRSIEVSLASLARWQATFRVRLPEAGERHLSAHSSPEQDPDGSVVWHGLVTDVTQEVLSAQERVRLQRERDRAQGDAQARADALSRISHELRTPLNAILGFTQLMQAALAEGAKPRNDATEPWQNWTEQVRRAGSHLLALVNSVLERSSLEARRFVVDLQPMDAADIARQVVEMARPQAISKQQALDAGPAVNADSPGAANTWVRADKRALRQVLINLVGNASKYTPAGGRIDVCWSIAAHRRLRLAVSDNGPGISASEQARLFTPFERGAQSSGGTDGTGLGLVISRQLVHAMGGHLSVRSVPGQGSVFAVDLPLADVQVEAQAAASTGESLFGSLETPGTEPPPELPPSLVLYIEDDPVNGLLMQEFAARTAPLQLHLAVNMAQGLQAARSLAPDLVLLDMNLPDGTGHELLQQLRADPATASLRVVALSADAMPEQIQRAMDAGFDDYWTKPVDFTQLRRRLGRLLKG